LLCRSDDRTGSPAPQLVARHMHPSMCIGAICKKCALFSTLLSRARVRSLAGPLHVQQWADWPWFGQPMVCAVSVCGPIRRRRFAHLHFDVIELHHRVFPISCEHTAQHSTAQRTMHAERRTNGQAKRKARRQRCGVLCPDTARIAAFMAAVLSCGAVAPRADGPASGRGRGGGGGALLVER
jgi:hypothetical protein